jgi:hypothetical protein
VPRGAPTCGCSPVAATIDPTGFRLWSRRPASSRLDRSPSTASWSAATTPVSPSSTLLRQGRRENPTALVYTFGLIEGNGDDLRYLAIAMILALVLDKFGQPILADDLPI